VKALNDPVEQEHYMQKIAAYTNTSLETLKEKLDTTDQEKTQELKPVHVSGDVRPDPAAHQDSMLALTLIDPATRELLAEVSEDMLATDERKEVLRYVRQYTDIVQAIPKELQDYETYVKILLLRADARYGQWSDEDRYFEAARLVRLTITEHKQIQKDALTSALRIAEDEGDDSEALRLRQALNELIKEIPRAKR
jgi:DNA primase